MWHNGDSREAGARIIKQSLEKLETQKKNLNINDQNLEINNNNDTSINITQCQSEPMININKGSGVEKRATNMEQSNSITNGNNINQQAQSQINSLELRNLSTSNNFNNQFNVAPNNKKTRICLVIVGLIFIIVGICLLFTAPEIAIVFLVIGGLLFIGAIGFNKFCPRLCFDKSQSKNSQLEQNKKSINERTKNLVDGQYPNTNYVNNENSLIQN